MSYSEECCKCLYCERDPGSNSGWYCTWRQTHVGATESCYKFESKYQNEKPPKEILRGVAFSDDQIADDLKPQP